MLLTLKNSKARAVQHSVTGRTKDAVVHPTQSNTHAGLRKHRKQATPACEQSCRRRRTVDLTGPFVSAAAGGMRALEAQGFGMQFCHCSNLRSRATLRSGPKALSSAPRVH